MLSWSSGAVANALDTLINFGVAELATDKPCTFRLAPGASQPAGATAATGGRGLTQVAGAA